MQAALIRLVEKMAEVFEQRLAKTLRAAIRLAETPGEVYEKVLRAALKDLVVLQAGIIKRTEQRTTFLAKIGTAVG